jgi:hypothetical protein
LVAFVSVPFAALGFVDGLVLVEPFVVVEVFVSTEVSVLMDAFAFALAEALVLVEPFLLSAVVLADMLAVECTSTCVPLFAASAGPVPMEAMSVSPMRRTVAPGFRFERISLPLCKNVVS